jgi:hypothetical protein
VRASPATRCVLPDRPTSIDLAEVGFVCDWKENAYICLTIENAVRLGQYVRDAKAYQDAAEVCRGK